MSNCSICDNEVPEADGCAPDRKIVVDGVELNPIPNGEEAWIDDETPDKLAEQDCPNCGAENGKYHHPICDHEVCPNCGGQYIWCKCGQEALARPDF